MGFLLCRISQFMPYVIFGSIVYREQNFHEFRNKPSLYYSFGYFLDLAVPGGSYNHWHDWHKVNSTGYHSHAKFEMFAFAKNCNVCRPRLQSCYCLIWHRFHSVNRLTLHCRIGQSERRSVEMCDLLNIKQISCTSLALKTQKSHKSYKMRKKDMNNTSGHDAVNHYYFKWMKKCSWGWQNRTDLGKCTHLYDETQGAIKHN